MEEKQKQQEDEINLLDYLIVLLKRKRLIIGITFGAALITAIISLIIPPVYRAETKILPPQQSSSSLTTGMLSQIAGVSDIASSALGLKTPGELYIGMLKSRTIADSIIDRFNLMELYKTKYREDAREKLIEDVLGATGDKKNGIITISVEDKDPKRAADMANAFVEELRNLTKGLAVTEAAQRRLFFEEQLKDVKATLLRSEEAMRGFQEKTGALQVESQAKAVIEGIADLRAQIAAKEVEIKVMKTYSTPNNPDLQKAEEALKGLKAELNKLEAKGSSGHDPFMPTGRMPAVGTEYMRKLRDLKFNETLYELLTKQYEAARLDEARDAVVIQIIDKAIPPEKKAKPKRTLMVAVATFSGFFLAIFTAFLLEYIEKVSNSPENKRTVETLKKFASLKVKQ